MVYDWRTGFPRHRRPAQWSMCACGCEDRVVLGNRKWCVVDLNERLEKQGFKVVRLEKSPQS